MEKNFKLLIEYDGTDLHGWQRQPEKRSVQGEIESALSTMSGRKVTVHGSGRTDAGVHALGQTASFRCDTRLDGETFQKGLNSLLPADIVIRECREAAPDFHARYSARRKAYRYRILNRPLPAAVGRLYAWHIRHRLDLEAMRQGTAHLLGCRDFRSFEGTGSPRSSTVRTVFRAQWESEDKDLLVFEIEADGFLRFMVRNIVGTLVEVGQGKRAPDDVARILAAGHRECAGPTAPAHGLFLVQVWY